MCIWIHRKVLSTLHPPRPLLSGIRACRASHAFARNKVSAGLGRVPPSPAATQLQAAAPRSWKPRGLLMPHAVGEVQKDSHLLKLAQCCHGQSMSLRTMRAGYHPALLAEITKARGNKSAWLITPASLLYTDAKCVQMCEAETTYAQLEPIFLCNTKGNPWHCNSCARIQWYDAIML